MTEIAKQVTSTQGLSRPVWEAPGLQALEQPFSYPRRFRWTCDEQALADSYLKRLANPSCDNCDEASAFQEQGYDRLAVETAEWFCRHKKAKGGFLKLKQSLCLNACIHIAHHLGENGWKAVQRGRRTQKALLYAEASVHGLRVEDMQSFEGCPGVQLRDGLLDWLSYHDYINHQAPRLARDVLLGIQLYHQARKFLWLTLIRADRAAVGSCRIARSV